MKARTTLFLITFVCSVIFIFFFRYPILSDQYILGGGDVNRGIYWMQKWQDPDLFVNDPVSDYLESTISPGMKGVYRALSCCVDPVAASRWVPVALFFLTILFLFLCVNKMSGKWGATTSAFIFMGYEGYAHIFSSGTQSDFMLPIFCALLYFIYSNRPAGTAIAAILAALFYPSIFILCGLIILVWQFFIKEENSHVKGMVRRLFKTALLLFPAVCSMFIFKMVFGSKWGAIVTAEQMKMLSVFGPEGSDPFVGLSTLEWIFSVRSGFTPSWAWDLLLTFSIIFILIPGRSKKSARNFTLLLTAGSLFLFVIAHLMAIRIGFPNNYVRSTLPLYMIIWIGIENEAFMNYLREKYQKMATACFAIWLAFLTCSLIPFWNWGVEDFSHQKDLFSYLKTLPKDVLVVGHPKTLEAAATFSGRKMFVARQAEGGLHYRYLKMYATRMKDFINAYYAPDKERFCVIAKEHGFNILVVDKAHFGSGYLRNSGVYQSPYDKIIRRTATATDRYYVLEVPEELILFNSADIFIFEVQCP